MKVSIGPRAAFDAAAAGYDDHAGFQREVAGRLAEQIGALALPAAPFVLEIGCGTGALTARLRALLPGAALLATDVAPRMVAACRERLGDSALFAALDGEAPALADGRCDLVAANLAFQWFGDLPAALRRLRGLLAPGGWLAVATLGPGSLSEWAAAHRAEGLPSPVRAYPDADWWREAWPGEVRLLRERVVVRHGDGLAFLRQLRGLGAAVPVAGHAALGAGALRRVLGRFEAGGAAIGYEVIYACCRV